MNNLILYFSWSGNTDKLVKEVNKHFNFTTERIERLLPYSADYDTCAYVEAKEEWEKRSFPQIKDLTIDVNKFDRILLFFPIWWYTFPMPIATLFKQLKGYKGEIVLFENSYTNDPQYVKNCLNDFNEIDSNLNIKQGLFNKDVKEHIKFIKGE